MPSTGVVSSEDAHGAGRQLSGGVLARARTRLTARLDRCAQMLVLQAPPGFGKTMLLDRWVAGARADGRQVHHYRADVLQPQDVARLPDGAVLVVDDVDHALTPELTEALLALPHRPGRVQMLLSGRDVQDVRRAAWRRGLQVSTLDGEELAATAAELAEMAREWGHDLTPGGAEELYAATGGWPAVARLLLDGAELGSGISLDAAVDYLDAAVLDELGEPVRRAATVLALAGDVSDWHIAAVTAGQEDPPVGERELITALERAGILLRASRDTAWTMLPVVRHTLLAGRHGLSSRAARRWHSRFARALRGRDEEAHVGQILRHARAGEDWEVLSEIWTRYGMGLLDRCHEDVVAAYADLPQHVLAQWSYLTVPAAVVAWTAEQRPYADVYRAFCNSLRPLAAAYRTNEDQDIGLEDRLAGISAVLATDRMDGHLRRALATAERASPQVAALVADGPAPMRYAWFLMQWAMTALAAADWQAGLELFSRGFDAAHATRGAEFVAASCAANMALLTAFDGSTTETRHWLTQYEHFADPTSRNYGHFSRPAHLAQALLAMDAMDEEGTIWHLEQAGEVGTDQELWPFNVYLRSQQALIFGDPVGMLSRLDRIRATHPAQANVDGAGRRLLHRMEAELLLALSEVNRAQALLADRTEPWLATSRARLHLITGDVDRARAWASSGAWAPAITTRDRLDRLMIQAAATELQGMAGAADDLFRQAGALAAQIGTVRGFPLVPRRVLDGLLARSPGVLGGADLDRVRRARTVYPEHAALITLSEREQVVLQEMVRCDSVRQIAAALTVSPNTVKKQVVAVYTKLGVHDRESALLEARRLGLLTG